MTDALQRLKLALLTEGPLLRLRCPDEERALDLLRRAAAGLPPGDWRVHEWSCTGGWDPPWGSVGADTRDPVAALQAVLEVAHCGLFVLKDLLPHLARPAVTRALRDLFYALQDDDRRLVVALDASGELPSPLDRAVPALELAEPDDEERRAAITALLGQALPQPLAQDLARALRGLGMDELRGTLRGIAALGAFGREDVLAHAFAARTRSARQAGALEFVPPRWTIDRIGGLDTLKEWLRGRQELFTLAAAAEGLPTPRGLLLMGVSGCGKSFAAKAVSALWGVPLVRLDMNLVFSGLHGSPEATFHRTLRAVEGLAPVVLWIDEIENGLGQGGADAQQHLFSAFLTWLQEKPPLVFVVATANRIEDLPAELLRKGRFDEIFFCDLPTEQERRVILEIHLRAHGADPGDFRAEVLVHLTRGWSGAELEQAVLAARLAARREERAFVERDLLRSIEQAVPLSRTMSEQIRALREWAYGRAVPASAAPEQVEVEGP